MNTPQGIEITFRRRASLFVVAATAVIGLTACSHVLMMHGTGAKRPAPGEFGLGPRTSANGRYTATLAPSGQLKPRRMQTLRVTVTGTDGRPVDGAKLTIDGGMPQHGHGLPTRPRVTRNLGDGNYEIEGVRFNMGGWWEFKVAVTAGAGSDTVTFNLAL